MTLETLDAGKNFQTEFMLFVRLKPNPKTERFLVMSRMNVRLTGMIHLNDSLGIVKWHAPWRRYCTFLNKDTNLDAKCHTELAEFLTMLMDERKKKRK